MHAIGRGVPKDYVEAVKWYHKAAEQGYADAQDTLGMMYFGGQSVREDYAESAKWYRKAAEQEHKYAQHSLAVMYFEGQGVPQDYAEAMRWFRKLADRGDASAQNYLGLMYHDSLGVPKDFAEAAKWHRKAAEQGNADAQYNLGMEIRPRRWRAAGLCPGASVVQSGRRGRLRGHLSPLGKGGARAGRQEPRRCRRQDDVSTDRGSAEARPRMEAHAGTIATRTHGAIEVINPTGFLAPCFRAI
jgi:hypothetical protein